MAGKLEPTPDGWGNLITPADLAAWRDGLAEAYLRSRLGTMQAQAEKWAADAVEAYCMRRAGEHALACAVSRIWGSRSARPDPPSAEEIERVRAALAAAIERRGDQSGP